MDHIEQTQSAVDDNKPGFRAFVPVSPQTALSGSKYAKRITEPEWLLYDSLILSLIGKYSAAEIRTRLCRLPGMKPSLAQVQTRITTLKRRKNEMIALLGFNESTDMILSDLKSIDTSLPFDDGGKIQSADVCEPLVDTTSEPGGKLKNIDSRFCEHVESMVTQMNDPDINADRHFSRWDPTYTPGYSSSDFVMQDNPTLAKTLTPSYYSSLARFAAVRRTINDNLSVLKEDMNVETDDSMWDIETAYSLFCGKLRWRIAAPGDLIDNGA